MKRILFLALVLCSLCSWAQQVFIPATDNHIQYVGRMTLRSHQYAEFTYPGLQISCTFTGHNIAFVAKPKSGYFMAQLDGGTPYKVNVASDSVVAIASQLRNDTHTLFLTYINEGAFTKPRFYGFLLDEGAALQTPPALPERKIEFIGNSITCALGIEGTGPKDPSTPANQNQYISYEAITCRNLQAQCMVVARSGIGVYRNCLGNPEGDPNVMPALYPYVLFNKQGGFWDFSTYIPDVVCINLGTNDTTHPSYSVDLLSNGMYNFYKDLRSHYPTAKIVLLTGTMIKRGTTRFQNLTTALDSVRAKALQQDGDSLVYRLDFTPEDGTMGYGCAYHPSARRHAQMAKELTTFLRQITGWE